MLHQLDENKLLMMEYNSLKNMLEAHEDSADKLRKALEEKDACIVNHEKNIKALEVLFVIIDKTHPLLCPNNVGAYSVALVRTSVRPEIL
jgi:hypothetical protein